MATWTVEVNRAIGTGLLAVLAAGGCGPEFEKAKWETILPGSTEPQHVIDSGAQVTEAGTMAARLTGAFSLCKVEAGNRGAVLTEVNADGTFRFRVDDPVAYETVRTCMSGKGYQEANRR
jgi:hypothetical protein